MADTFTCPVCQMVSHHPEDVKHCYCGACHRFFPIEMGRELKASDLTPKTVVILTKEGRDTGITAWVAIVGEMGVSFYVGDLRMYCICFRIGDELYDDNGRMRIYQYLGGPEPTSGEENAKGTDERTTDSTGL